MEKAMLDLTPPSMENTPPVLAGVEVIQEQQENPGQAVVDWIPYLMRILIHRCPPHQREDRERIHQQRNIVKDCRLRTIN
ncbi:hypothetical protein CgunFtcFv8_004152 [Champsocephalus gunnari]|nr:hypothetical protein CgunFtcFv8_004152 [Champsocephalus gunnari]